MTITIERTQAPITEAQEDEVTIGELFDALGTDTYRSLKLTGEEKEQLLVDVFALQEPLNLLQASAQRNELNILPDASNAVDIASLLLHDAFINREAVGLGTSWADYLMTN